MSQGVLYIAFGDNFLKELTLSAESVKRFCPDLHITVFSDKPVDSEFIDECRIIEVNHLRPKIDYIMHAPYERTLFLDTDTIIDYDIGDMFDILDNFDIALAHDLARKRKKYSDTIPEYGEIPYSFSELNTGVIAFKKNEKTDLLWERWRENIYKWYDIVPRDQPSFRVSLWQTTLEDDLKLYVFPVEYNIRSKANREKNRLMHDEFGDEHLTPRIYHMHADPRINQGTYEVESVEQALEFCKKNFVEY